MRPLAATLRRALLESTLAGALLFLAVFLSAPADAPRWILRQGVDLLVVPVFSGLLALRLERPTRWWCVLFPLALDGLRLAAFPEPSRLTSAGGLAFGLIATLGFLLARGVALAFASFAALASRRLAWSLALSQARAVAVVVGLAVFALAYRFATSSLLAGMVRPGASASEGLATRLIAGFLPQAVVAGTLATLAVLLVVPLLAGLSRLSLRRTVDRVGRLRDVAQRLAAGRLSERAAVEGADEVAELMGSLNTMAGRLEGLVGELSAERDRVSSLLAERQRLLVTVSHELRTPLATGRALLEGALGAEPPRRDDLVALDGELQRLSRLLDDLFTLARADAGRLAVTREAIDAAAIARETGAAFRELLWSRGRMELLLELPEGPLPAVGDADRLKQALGNLLQNALRYGMPGALVRVAARRSGASVEIEVRDTGPGISAERLRLLEAREPASRLSGAPDGAGIGLLVVRELAEAMGGRVSVESREGEGTAITLTLPAPA